MNRRFSILILLALSLGIYVATAAQPALLDDADAMVEGGRARELFGILIARLPQTIIVSASRSMALADLHLHTMEIGSNKADASVSRLALAHAATA